MSSWANFASQVKQQRGESSRGSPSTSSLSVVPSRERKRDEGKNVSTSSSFLGLKAELAERKFEERKDATTSYLEKKEKRLPAHLRPSPDVVARSLKHDHRQTTSSWANTPSSQLDAARIALERKAAIYDKLKKGATGGLDEQRLQDSLIDWDRKDYHAGGGSGDSSSEEEDSDQSKSVGKGGTDSEEDPWTEYEDDLGRMRRVRRSRVPRDALRARGRAEEEELDEDMVSYGPSTSFPVYQPDPASIQEKAERNREGYKRKDGDHFDANFEKRYRGAGYYQFSQDEETRKKQMEALRKDRDETEQRRKQESAGVAEQSLGERRREKRRKYVEVKRREVDERRKRLAAGLPSERGISES